MTEERQLNYPEWELLDHNWGVDGFRYLDGFRYTVEVKSLVAGNLVTVLQIPIFVPLGEPLDEDGNPDCIEYHQSKMDAVRQAITLITKIYNDAQFIAKDRNEMARAAGLDKEDLKYVR